MAVRTYFTGTSMSRLPDSAGSITLNFPTESDTPSLREGGPEARMDIIQPYITAIENEFKKNGIALTEAPVITSNNITGDQIIRDSQGRPVGARVSHDPKHSITDVTFLTAPGTFDAACEATLNVTRRLQTQAMNRAWADLGKLGGPR